MPENFFGGGAILMGVLMIVTSAFKWPAWLNYIWAVFILIWGVIAFVV